MNGNYNTIRDLFFHTDNKVMKRNCSKEGSNGMLESNSKGVINNWHSQNIL